MTLMDSNLSALTANHLEHIAALRLLIARAANRDSLAWWDDESLTPHASVLFERLFPFAPPLAARQLALASARARHTAAFESVPGALHLFHLDPDNQVELSMRSLRLLDVAFPPDPITSIDALRSRLRALLGGAPAYQVIEKGPGHGLRLMLSARPDAPPAVHHAQALAWAYLEAPAGQPVFPFFTPEAP